MSLFTFSSSQKEKVIHKVQVTIPELDASIFERNYLHLYGTEESVNGWIAWLMYETKKLY